MSNSVINNPATVNSSTPSSPRVDNGNRPLTEQVDKLRGILLRKDTAETLGQGLGLLFSVVKETMVLLWLAFCWCIVAIAWLGNKTTQAGQQAKQQWTTFQESTQDRTPSDIAAETSKTVLNSSKTVMEQILTTAKKQVGILDDESQN
ncbi:hypothetical protein [Pantanalinema sp. GBBB05]|uniref:hypothetical protein n=1 Tax=Pantanalinema sp. GBBB05 TaxID=2604139 RepID=UPI001DB9918A|nr:hypothetical protein [Pantanalinema sp. GBBB05]